MKVVGLSGAQGGGKSTMLLELRARGWALDDFRVSRAVQKQLGWDSLDRVMESPHTMMEFQNEVYQQKFANDYKLQQLPGARTMDPKGEVILTERTFADICAYANLWSWRFVDSGKLSLGEAIDFLTDFTHRCAKAHNTIYGATLLLPLMSHVEWENDPNRASKADVVSVFEDIERFIERKAHITHKRLRITAASVADRADQVETFLRTL